MEEATMAAPWSLLWGDTPLAVLWWLLEQATLAALWWLLLDENTWAAPLLDETTLVVPWLLLHWHCHGCCSWNKLGCCGWTELDWQPLGCCCWTKLHWLLLGHRQLLGGCGPASYACFLTSCGHSGQHSVVTQSDASLGCASIALPFWWDTTTVHLSFGMSLRMDPFLFGVSCNPHFCWQHLRYLVVL